MKKFLAFLLIAFIFCAPEEEQNLKDNMDTNRELLRIKAQTWIMEHGYWDLLSNTYREQGFNAAVELCKQVFDTSTCMDVVYENFVR